MFIMWFCLVLTGSRTIFCVCFFFFKQKTAYELRISDWSSDVCSSDLIISSRSFGSPCYDYNGLHSMVSTFIARATAKLRKQGSYAGRVCVWLETNRFREQDVQYHPAAGIRLPNPDRKSTRLNSSH